MDTPRHMGRWWGGRRLMDTPRHMGRWWGGRRLHGYAKTYGEMVGWQEIDGYANSRTYGEMVGWQEIAWIRQNIWGDGGVAGDCMDTPTPKHMGRWWGGRRLHGYANSRTYGEMVGWQEIAWIRQLPNIRGDGGVAGDCMDTPTPEHNPHNKTTFNNQQTALFTQYVYINFLTTEYALITGLYLVNKSNTGRKRYLG